MTTPVYEVNEAFQGLFKAFTNEADSIGSQLTNAMHEASRDAALLVSTASDIVLFPGQGRPAQIESFRRSTRGFIEMTAVSHVPLAIGYVARMREMAPESEAWRERLLKLRHHMERTRAANTVSLWRDQVSLSAFAGLEPKITAMVEYTLSRTTDYVDRALKDPTLLEFSVLRDQYFAPPTSVLPVSMNDIMFSTFGLAYVDIAYRIQKWLTQHDVDWQRAMVLVSGRSGRPTAGATWSSNNMCNLIWRATNITHERVYVAPHAPGFSVQNLPDEQGMVELEASFRRIWCHTRASVEASRRMFDGYEAYVFTPSPSEGMPVIRSLDDREACVARLRRIMEDPQQLLSNCVADYVVDALSRNGNRPEQVEIPGFTNVTFPS